MKRSSFNRRNDWRSSYHLPGHIGASQRCRYSWRSTRQFSCPWSERHVQERARL